MIIAQDMRLPFIRAWTQPLGQRVIALTRQPMSRVTRRQTGGLIKPRIFEESARGWSGRTSGNVKQRICKVTARLCRVPGANVVTAAQSITFRYKLSSEWQIIVL